MQKARAAEPAEVQAVRAGHAGIKQRSLSEEKALLQAHREVRQQELQKAALPNQAGTKAAAEVNKPSMYKDCLQEVKHAN